MFGAGRLPAAGSSEIDGTAAVLGLRAGLGIYFPPNPLVESTDMGHWQGLRLVRGAGHGVAIVRDAGLIHNNIQYTLEPRMSKEHAEDRP